MNGLFRVIASMQQVPLPPCFAKQFVNISVFDPLFKSNHPVGLACWASIECPDRTLIAGDFMFRAQFT